MRADPVEILDSEGEFDKSSTARSPQLLIAKVDSSSEEEDLMDLNPRKGLKDLMVGQNKGSSSKEALKSQLPLTFPSPPPPSNPIVGLLPNPNLKMKRKEQVLEEGKVAHQKEAKQ